jgi:cystathionine gamma-lyase
MSEYRSNDSHFATKAIHVGQEPEQWSSMSVVAPISLATTFKQDGPADFKQ